MPNKLNKYEFYKDNLNYIILKLTSNKEKQKLSYLLTNLHTI